MSKIRPVDHHMYKYDKRKHDKQEVEVDGKTILFPYQVEMNSELWKNHKKTSKKCMII